MCKKIIDISVSIAPSMPIYPGDPQVAIRTVADIDTDGCSVSEITLGSHTGTHIDAPSHILKNGTSMDRLCLEELIGNALVLDLSSNVSNITSDDLDRAYSRDDRDDDCSILLIKTSNSRIWNEMTEFDLENMVCLDESAAEWVVHRGFTTVGVDGFSVEEGEDSDLPIHRILFENDMNIVECLDLGEAEEGSYYFICLPLKLKDGNGAPARAIIVTDK
ncbi:MAG: cyclase family protein [Euryarchaeota archaeon]|nr:cyclase family protein [Euryarchaeota archaeon]